MNDSDVSREIGELCIGQIAGQSQTVHGSQRLDAPQAAAVRLVPLSPDVHWIRLLEKNPQDHRGIDVDDHLRRRSSRSVLTAETERRGRTPLIFARALTGREGAATWNSGSEAGRIRTTL